MTASVLSKKFLIWFQNKYPTARIYRNNSGAIKTAKGLIRYGIPNKGGSDYIAFIPCCYLLPPKQTLNILKAQFYEIKTKKDKMSKEQIKFANMITQIMGGEYYIVHEITEKMAYLSGVKGNNIERVLYHISNGFYLEKWNVK